MYIFMLTFLEKDNMHIHDRTWWVIVITANEKNIKGVIRLVLPGIERNGIVVEIGPNKKILDWDYNLDHAENESM